ncbi:hypothetical protein RT42_GL000697 [Enterococcus cecorum DSM 20682 = ATCC 43198]|nr:hypothetical protein RT42_GL000697 [Enterococcus cecorum DSM 20682 = ATCC 43198]
MLRNIQNDFDKEKENSELVQQLLQILEEGQANYRNVNAYAVETGELLAKVLNKNITAEILPDGKMYFNIADRVLNTTLQHNHKLITDYSMEVLSQLNKNKKIGITVKKPPINQDRIDSLVNKLVSKDDFELVKFVLKEPIVNFSQSIVDDTIEINADFHIESGMSPKLKRKAEKNACKWCKDLDKIYEYRNLEDKSVFSRHDNCRCTVEFFPDGEKSKNKQNIHSKRIIKARSEDLKRISNEAKKKSNNRNKLLEMLAREEAERLGYNPVATNKVVNKMRDISKKWEIEVSEEQESSIKKYTYNGTDDDGKKLYFKINEYLEGRYTPKNSVEEEILIRNIANIESGLMKFKLDNDIIVYRNDKSPEYLEGESKKFISTSVVANATLGKKANVAIIVPKGSNGGYVEMVAHKDFKKQREYMINTKAKLELLKKTDDLYIYVLR